MSDESIKCSAIKEMNNRTKPHTYRGRTFYLKESLKNIAVWPDRTVTIGRRDTDEIYYSNFLATLGRHIVVFNESISDTI